MTMHVNLSAEMEGFIKEKVAGGFYGNATEVIRDAIRRRPRARRNSPSRSVTTGSRADSFDVTPSVSRQTPRIASAISTSLRDPASQLHRPDARTYSRGC